MAITRSQQAKQMLQDGGRIGLFKGAQADTRRGKAMSPGTTASGGVRDDFKGAPPGRDTSTKSPVKDKLGGQTQKRFDRFREDFINKPLPNLPEMKGFSKFLSPFYNFAIRPAIEASNRITNEFNIDKVAKAGRYIYTDPETGEEFTFDQDLALSDPEMFERASRQLKRDRCIW